MSVCILQNGTAIQYVLKPRHTRHERMYDVDGVNGAHYGWVRRQIPHWCAFVEFGGDGKTWDGSAGTSKVIEARTRKSAAERVIAESVESSRQFALKMRDVFAAEKPQR